MAAWTDRTLSGEGRVTVVRIWNTTLVADPYGIRFGEKLKHKDIVEIYQPRIAQVGSIAGLAALRRIIDVGDEHADIIRCVDDHGIVYVEYTRVEGAWRRTR